MLAQIRLVGLSLAAGRLVFFFPEGSAGLVAFNRSHQGRSVQRPGIA